MKSFLGFIVVMAIVAIVAILFKRSSLDNNEANNFMNNFSLTSSEFKNNDFIPRKYTCEGENINPPLLIQSVPPEAKSLVLIVDDPDASMGTWDHWLMWDIDPKTQSINEDDVPLGAIQGTTSGGNLKYDGPCPPKGKPHRYMFKLYALDRKLNLTKGAVKSQIEKEMQEHILTRAVLTGLYEQK